MPSYLLGKFFGGGVSQGSAPAFSPSDIAGGVGWYDFSDATKLFQLSNGTTAVSADADPIGFATDKFAVPNNIIQATAGNRATYKTAIQNGRSVARFVLASAQRLAKVVNTNNPCTVFIAGSCATVGGASAVLFGGNAAESAAVFYRRGASGKWSSFGGTAECEDGASDTSFHVFTLVYNGASTVMRIDGSVAALTPTDPGAPNLSGIGIGAYSSGDLPSDSDIGEVILYAGALTGANLTNPEAFLKSRWGTP